jgi:hypothetical protein
VTCRRHEFRPVEFGYLPRWRRFSVVGCGGLFLGLGVRPLCFRVSIVEDLRFLQLRRRSWISSEIDVSTRIAVLVAMINVPVEWCLNVQLLIYWRRSISPCIT